MANKQIKGLTIEIGGDTTKLGKALKDSEDKSKSLQAELRQIETALKFNPDNVELLTQKQELLTRQVKETADALDILKQAEKQVTAQFNSGEIGEEQFRAFKREIVETESKLKNYESKLGETEKKLKGLADGTDIAERETKEFKDELKKAEDTLGDVKDAASDLAEGLGKIGAAGVAGATAAIMSANNTETALNSLQAQTGLTEEQMGEFKESLEDLYKGNYGESMEALADAMAKVAQFTGETDPTKIEDMTRNLITLEDTFGMDFNETLRGVDALMKNMGLSADEAFNLIAKGAQNGLNKSDELGDNLAEYTQLWAQAGFSAEEMFAILDNGLDSGAYNLDKVNDFVKEFAISLADGRIEENLDSFSSETQDLFDAWKKGKATSAQVFKSVIKDLKKTTNEQDALTTASNVWSSLGEDNALKIIQSLGDVNETFQDVGGTMEEINDIKYDDVGSRFKALGRTVMVDVVNPIGEKLLPIAEKFIEYASENLDDIIPVVKTLGAAFATIFVVNKVATFIDSIKSLSGVISSLFTMISAHPLAALAIGLGAVAAGVIAWTDATYEQIEKEWGLTEAEKELNETIAARADSIREADEARVNSMGNIDAEAAHNHNLWDELQKIVDANGNIKKGYEDRAAVITGLLAESLGIEIQIVDGQIQKYEELKKSIEEVINTKRAEALLDVNKESYATAISEQADAYAEYTEKIKQFNDSQDDLNAALEREVELFIALQAAPGDQKAAVQQEYLKAAKAVDAATEAHKANRDALDQAQENYLGYCNTIEQYEGLMAAIASGDAAQLAEAMDKLSNNFITAGNASREMLEQQVADFQSKYEIMKQAVAEGMPGVTQEQVDQMANLVKLAKQELDKLPPEALNTGKKAGSNLADGLGGMEQYAIGAGLKIAGSANTAMGAANTTATGEAKASEYVAGIQSGDPRALLAGMSVVSSANKGFGTANTQGTGATKASQFAGGIQSQSGYALLSGQKVGGSADKGLGSPKTNLTGENIGLDYGKGLLGVSGDAKKAGKAVAEKGKDGLESVEANDAGADFGDGFASGISSKESTVWDKAVSLAQKALAAVEDWLGIASPSKEAKRLGGFFGQGFGDGIDEEHDAVVKQAESLADDALAALDRVNAVEFGGFGRSSDFLRADRVLHSKALTATQNSTNAATATLAAKLDALSDKLGRLQIVLDTGTLVGETIDKIDAGLAEKQILTARGG